MAEEKLKAQKSKKKDDVIKQMKKDFNLQD
jgi:hypothetical protein